MTSPSPDRAKSDAGISGRLNQLLGLLLTTTLMVAAAALALLYQVTRSVDTIVADRVVPLVELHKVKDGYATTPALVAHRVRDGTLDAAAGPALIEASAREAQDNWRAYQLTFLVSEEQELIAQATPALQTAARAGEALAGLLRANDLAGLRRFVGAEFDGAVIPAGLFLDRLIELQGAEAQRELERSHTVYRYALLGGIAIVGLSVVMGIGLAWALMRRYVRERSEGEHRLRALNDNLPNCMVYQVVQELDGRFRFLHVSEPIKRLTGVPAAEVLRDAGAVMQLVDPDDRAALRAALQQSGEQMEIFDSVVRLHHPDGRLRWMQFASSPRRLDDGRICWDGVLADITETRATDMARREHEAMLAAVIHSASDAVISTDVMGRVTLFNPAAEGIFGRPAAAMLGQPLDSLMPARAQARHATHMAAFAASGVSSRRISVGRVQGVRADGAILELEASISQVTVNDKQVLTATLRDVTERVRAERSLLKYQLELTELTHQLMAQEKATTMRLAQVLHDQLGQVLAAMRIDFVSEARLPDPAQAARHARVDRLIDEAIREVRQVLVELRPTLLDEHGLVEALDNEIRTRQRSADGARLHLEVAAEAQGQRWSADVEYAVFMVVREALANALRHARAQDVRISVDGGPHQLRVEVVDNGNGFVPGTLTVRPGHLGMVGMRERAMAIGARFEVRSSPQDGTALLLTWEAMPA